MLAIPLLLASLLSAADEAAMRPFVMDHRGGAGSAIDLSFLLDAPAGKRGFVRVAGGRLQTPDGKRLKLWGVNVTDWSKGSAMLPPKEDSPMWAATLARFGVNCVRLHFLDLAAPRGLIDNTKDHTQSFDAAQLDRLDFWIAELKKRGIYINLNLNVGRSYKPGDGVAEAQRIGWAKGITLYDARLIELQKDYAKQLLTHVNPYTKLEYRNEPAIVTVELLNENALYVGFRAPAPSYEQDLLEKYNAWLKKTLTADELAKLRAIVGVAEGQPVPRLTGQQTAAAPKERYHIEKRFFVEMESNFYKDMAAYLRQLGVKPPIVATADHAHNGSSYSMLYATSLLDIVDGHTYWQHPGNRAKQNTPMVNEPGQSTAVELSRTAFAGKPYTVSEVNHPFPNEYAAEGIPILAAYSALQDWDGVFWYTFEPKIADWKPYIGDPYDISLDPVKMPQLALGALMFLRGDVGTARKTIERTYSREQVFESSRLPRTERPYFTPGFPLALPLEHAVRISTLDGAPTAKVNRPDASAIVSDTGELAWHTTADGGLVTVDTARSQARIGFLKTPAKPLRHLTVDVENRFGAVSLSTLDDRPIARSGRLLVTAGAGSGNTGAEWNETRTALKRWGTPPTMIEPVKGRLLLSNTEKARAVLVAALDGSGKRIGAPVAARATTAGWEIILGSEVTTWYEVEVKR